MGEEMKLGPEELTIAMEFFHRLSPSQRREPELWKSTQEMCSEGVLLFGRYCYEPEENTEFLRHKCERCIKGYDSYMFLLYIISPERPGELDELK